MTKESGNKKSIELADKTCKHLLLFDLGGDTDGDEIDLVVEEEGERDAEMEKENYDHDAVGKGSSCQRTY
uniref:Uncharacterized protein n=1 Tax=Scophthalmus maximus TaxID=52904 RepID=A0A8D2ZYP0_SCOMX